MYVSFIFLECFSQQTVKTSKNTNMYDHNFSIIETIEKNKKIQISQYLFEYLNNGKNEYDYYAELINNYEGLKIRANDLIPEITDDIFDADILTKPGNVYFIDEYFQGLKKRQLFFAKIGGSDNYQSVHDKIKAERCNPFDHNDKFNTYEE